MFFLANECEGVASVVGIAKMVVNVIRIIAPIALIIWGSIDMLKAIIAGDDKKIAAARKPLIQRFVSAAIIFLIPWAFNAVITMISGNEDSSQWIKCWNSSDASWTKISDPFEE